MVNVSAVKRVIASLKGELPETRDLGFNMGAYVYPASPALPDHSGRNLAWVACICGHAYILETGMSFEEAKAEDTDEIEEIAQHYLGLDDDQADGLFFDLPNGLSLQWIPLEYAIATLECLAATCVIDWEERTYALAA